LSLIDLATERIALKQKHTEFFAGQRESGGKSSAVAERGCKSKRTLKEMAYFKPE
jgi:hypothetical protein